jgi:predicted small lipoprotein YifL
MPLLARRVIPLALLLALAGCGKKADPDAPLAFVPADTPYVLANLDAMPQPLVDEWTKLSREALPLSLAMYTRMLDRLDSTEQARAEVKAARAVLEEIKQHAAAGTLDQLGVKGSTHAAFYGIGVLPVFRLQLADPQQLRAAVARVEARAGAKLPTAKSGELEHWSLTLDKAQLLAAISGNHLVLSLAPASASEDLRKRLLGVTPPAKPLDPQALVTLNKRYGYTNLGSGYVDSVRLVEFIANEADPVRRELAVSIGGEEIKPLPEVCKQELQQIAARFPRLAFGYTALGPKSMTIHGQLEMDGTLAKEFAAAWTGAPGSAGKAEGLLDFSLALPVLKQKNFWLKQAKAAVEKPYACEALSELNDGFAKLRQSLDTTIPPPASDLTGIRLVLSRINFEAGAEKPDFAGKLLLGLSNPASVLAMGQLAVPALKDFKLAADGQPAALPQGMIPTEMPPLFAAMNDKALAVSAGAGEEAGLAAFLTAPAAAEPLFLRARFSGAMYGQLGGMMDKFAILLPEEQRADMDTQKQMFALYEKSINFAEFDMTAKDDGVAFYETIEMR